MASASPATSRSPPSPRQRTSKACEQCRRRKQRCDDSQIPCPRCVRVGKQCSFSLEVQRESLRSESQTGSSTVIQRMDQELKRVQIELRSMQTRVSRMESTISGDAATAPRVIDTVLLSAAEDRASAADVPVQMGTTLPTATSPTRMRDEAILRAPIEALRDLYAGRPESRVYCDTPTDKSQSGHQKPDRSHLDPMTRGFLSNGDAQRLFDIFFSACHELAPCLNKRSQTNAQTVRHANLLLFTSICLIGARYWDVDDAQNSHRTDLTWLHPSYSHLVALFDAQMLEMTLRPHTTDFCMEVVQALLISTQWPALQFSTSSAQTTSRRNGSHGDIASSRFNDAYAWVMIGLATRFARRIGLGVWQSSQDGSTGPISESELARMRVWLNLVSIDRHLTLTAGLPATLSPPSTGLIRTFGTHPSAELGDLKLAGLAELVDIVQRASVSCGDPSLRSLDAISLRVLNLNLDDWATNWADVLGPKLPSFRHTMPFTAYRWYRLALNAIPIALTLSQDPKDLIVSTPSGLSAGVEAAFSLLWEYSSEASVERPERHPLQASDKDDSTYRMNFAALSCFMFAIDAYWITHAYAAVFLVLLYDRGCIDSNLAAFHVIRLGNPAPVPQASRLFRIISFAVSIFDGVIQGANYHPAAQYRTVVTNALDMLKGYGIEGSDRQTLDDGAAPSGQDETSWDDLFSSLWEPGQEWAFLKDVGMSMT